MGWEPLRLLMLSKRAQSHRISVRSSLGETLTAKPAPPRLKPHQKRLPHLTTPSLARLDSLPANLLSGCLASPAKKSAWRS